MCLFRYFVLIPFVLFSSYPEATELVCVSSSAPSRSVVIKGLLHPEPTHRLFHENQSQVQMLVFSQKSAPPESYSADVSLSPLEATLRYTVLERLMNATRKRKRSFTVVRETFSAGFGSRRDMLCNIRNIMKSQ